MKHWTMGRYFEWFYKESDNAHGWPFEKTIASVDFFDGRWRVVIKGNPKHVNFATVFDAKAYTETYVEMTT